MPDFASSSPVLATTYAEEQLNGKKKSNEDNKEAKCQVINVICQNVNEFNFSKWEIWTNTTHFPFSEVIQRIYLSI